MKNQTLKQSKNAGLKWTKNRSITRRTVIWPGLVCNLKCVFCYNDGMAKQWRKFDGKGGLKEEIEKKRYDYGNEYIDFMGGEPTLHPRIVDIVKYCAKIGIKPTLITHGLALSNIDYARQLKEAGVNDFLVSIHGLNEIADKIFNVSSKGNFQKQLRAIENINKLGIKFRVNTTLIKWNKKELDKIAVLAIEKGALVINFIMFNPHFAWSNRKNISFQEKYSNIAPYLKKALDLCNYQGIEANVRYFPFCQLKGYEKHIYNCFQLPYDHHEWDYNSWYDYHADNPDKDWYYRAAQIQAQRNGSKQGVKCQICAFNKICDGFHEQYILRYGFDEADPYLGIKEISDPTEFIRQQWKIEEV